MRKNRKYFWKMNFMIMSGMAVMGLSGCERISPPQAQAVIESGQSNAQETGQSNIQEAKPGNAQEAESQKARYDKEKKQQAENIIRICQENFRKAEAENQPRDLGVMKSTVKELGNAGYTAIDSENQVNMTRNEQLLSFCKKVDTKMEGQATVAEVSPRGCVIWDFTTENGAVEVVRNYYGDKAGKLEKTETGTYRAASWDCTKEGYLMFSGSWYSEEMYALTMSSGEDYKAFRVLPLEEKYRELGRKYLAFAGYACNNMFITNWSEEDFGELDFSDIYTLFYTKVKTDAFPYTMNDNLGIGSVYEIPKKEFENVIRTFFEIDSRTLQEKVTYHPENAAYVYKPRGFYEAEYPEYPYSEVEKVTENPDGTMTLTAHVVFPLTGNSNVYTHEVVIRTLENGGMQYVSNTIIPSESNEKAVWHTPRLTEEEWEEFYGGR